MDLTGQTHDTYIKLIQMGARWYDPETGRFTQPDTIIPNPGNPQSFNRYAYALNNPLRYTDPSGHDPLDWLVDLVVGAGRQVLHNNALTVDAQQYFAPNAPESTAMTIGRHAGNLMTITQSIIEFDAGIAMITGGTAGGAATCLQTLGGGCAAGVAVDAAGVAVIAHGITVGVRGAAEEGAMIGDAISKITGKGKPSDPGEGGGWGTKSGQTREIKGSKVRVDWESPGHDGNVHVTVNGEKIKITDPSDLSDLDKVLRNDPWIRREVERAFTQMTQYEAQFK